MEQRLVDRTSELQVLRETADAAGASLVLVHGRRRVGKTYLLQNAWSDRRVFYYLAVNSTPDQNRRELLHELRSRFGDIVAPQDYPNWRTVFRLLGDLAGDDPLIVVLDEFQYLLGDEAGDSAVASQLNAAWEQSLSNREVTLVLCGSEVGTMRALGRQGALFGRLDRELHLEPFDFRQASGMVRARPFRERAYLYGIFGGTPDYLEVVEEGETLGDAVRSGFLQRGGKVYLQLSNLIEQEEGIREPGHYRAVLAAVAGGSTGVHEIAQAAGFDTAAGGRNRARRVLRTLRELGYVRRERNFDAGRTTPWRHHLGDNALAFWYRFVHPNRSLLQLEKDEEVWADRIRPHLDDYMGWQVFEPMAREAFRSLHPKWELPAPAEWSGWVGQDRDRRDIEIDLVCRLLDDRLLTGEVKWSSSPIGVEVHHALERDLRDLASSGRQWARDALDPRDSAGYLYVSAAGFSDTFRTRCDGDPRIHLVTLEDMYA